MSFGTSQTCVICSHPLTASQRQVGRTCDDWQCRLVYRRHLESGRGCCAVCGRPLSTFQHDRGAQTCRQTQCEVSFLLESRQSRGEDANARCGICGTLLRSDRRAIGVCRDRECCTVHTARRSAEMAAKSHRREERLMCVAVRRRETLAAVRGVTNPQDYPIVLVPHLSRRLADMPQDRRGEIRDHLTLLVHEAAAQGRSACSAPGDVEGPRGSPSRPEVEANLLAAACATCRGSCCRRGGNHAYLGPENIGRYLGQHPELSPREGLAEYLARVPDRSFEDSCVYHGPTGCGLPREMRSETCNRFYCPGLQQLRDDLWQGAPARAFLAVCGERHFVSGTFLDAEERPTAGKNSRNFFGRPAIIIVSGAAAENVSTPQDSEDPSFSIGV